MATADPVATATAGAEHLALFNAEAFHALNLTADQRVRRLDHVADGPPGGLAGGRGRRTATFRSGHSAPFGGPDFVRDAETTRNVVDTLAAAVARLDAEGVERIRVKARPAFYSGCEASVQFALLNLGFAVERCELNFHIELDGIAAADDYVARLRSPARRALRHAAQEPFGFAEARDEGEWARAYGVLAANRRAKDRALALPLDYVRRARDAFPGRVRDVPADPRGPPCAAALLYRVAPGRELVVYWGDAGHDLPRSPMNVLALRLVEMVVPRERGRSTSASRASTASRTRASSSSSAACWPARACASTWSGRAA